MRGGNQGTLEEKKNLGADTNKFISDEHEVHNQTQETLGSALATAALTMLPYWSVGLLVTRLEAESTYQMSPCSGLSRP